MTTSPIPVQMAPSGPAARTPLRRWLTRIFTMEFALGVLSVSAVGLLWEYAQPIGIPFIENLPPLSKIAQASKQLLSSHLYWEGWQYSIQRIIAGFLIAQAVGIPIGLIMAMNRASFETLFPIVEILRPIPPVAWIPVSIVFWPTL